MGCEAVDLESLVLYRTYLMISGPPFITYSSESERNLTNNELRNCQKKSLRNCQKKK